MEQETKDKLKKALPVNGRLLAAKKAGVSPATVTAVLGGVRDNDKVWDAVIEVIAEHKALEKERESRAINALS